MEVTFAAIVRIEHRPHRVGIVTSEPERDDGLFERRVLSWAKWKWPGPDGGATGGGAFCDATLAARTGCTPQAQQQVNGAVDSVTNFAGCLSGIRVDQVLPQGQPDSGAQHSLGYGLAVDVHPCRKTA